MENSRRVEPVPDMDILRSSPLRWLNFSITTPENSSGTSVPLSETSFRHGFSAQGHSSGFQCTVRESGILEIRENPAGFLPDTTDYNFNRGHGDSYFVYVLRARAGLVPADIAGPQTFSVSAAVVPACRILHFHAGPDCNSALSASRAPVSLHGVSLRAAPILADHQKEISALRAGPLTAGTVRFLCRSKLYRVNQISSVFRHLPGCFARNAQMASYA